MPAQRRLRAERLPGISRIPRERGVPRERRERNDHPIRRQPRRDKIRLIAIHLEGALRKEGAFALPTGAQGNETSELGTGE